MDNVVQLDCQTTQDIDADQVLSSALEESLEDVVVLGHDKDGQIYLSSSLGNIAEVNLMLDLAKAEILLILGDD